MEESEFDFLAENNSDLMLINPINQDTLETFAPEPEYNLELINISTPEMLKAFDPELSKSTATFLEFSDTYAQSSVTVDPTSTSIYTAPELTAIHPVTTSIYPETTHSPSETTTIPPETTDSPSESTYIHPETKAI